MAITDVRKLRSLTLTETKSDKGTIQLTGSEEYVAISDTANPSFSLIAQDTASWPKIGGPIPQINDSASFSGYDLYVTSRSLDYLDEENEFAVRIQVRYDAKSPEDAGGGGDPGGGGGGGADPDTMHRISISTQSATVPLTNQGENGEFEDNPEPAYNSAGDPVDGLTEDRALVKYTYTNTKVDLPDFEELIAYTNTTNKTPFLGCPRRTLRCLGWSGEWDDRNQFWTISVEFLYDPKTWVVQYYDVGFNEIVSGERRAILDIQGNPVSKPVPLDGTGKAVDASLVGVGSLSGWLKTRYAYPYTEKEFANLIQDCNI